MLVIRNIGQLLVVPPGPIGGRFMRTVSTIESAAILIDGERIAWFGPESDLKAPQDCESLDAAGGCVLPGLIDCHTHAVFAGTREKEFVQRLAGKTYLDIAHAGGGIRVTVEAVRKANREELVELALPRLRRMLLNGVTTIEIKSGYGLTVEDEIKILEVIRELKALQPIELVPTYLAAHTVPREFAGRPDEYLDVVLDNRVLGWIRDDGLAEFCDVFCEKTAFGIMQAYRVMEAGKKFGLRPKIHADQLTQMEASVLAARVGAISAGHLEKIDAAGIAAMRDAGCIAVLLPGCAFFLGTEQAPARTILDANLPVALATDFNPGSSMVESLPLVLSIACTQMRLSPTEAVVAATANAAAAVERHRRVGGIAVGMQADLVILGVPTHERWLYEPGRNCVRTVLKRGKTVVGSA